MIEERTYNKPKQKLIYSKDSSLNFGMQQSGNEANLLDFLNQIPLYQEVLEHQHLLLYQILLNLQQH